MKKKLLRLFTMVTKYTLYGTLLQFAFLSLVLASETEAQKIRSVKKVEIEVEFNKSGLFDVFSQIEEKTDYQFIYYSPDLNSVEKSFTLKKQKINVAELLLVLSENYDLAFKQVNNGITVKRSSGARKEKPEIEVLLQEMTVTGRVTSNDSPDGLPGVNVVLKGTAQGTVTDIDGRYRIEVPSPESVLVFSSVGFVTEEVTVGNKSVIDLLMVPDVTALAEVVVIGYGEQKKINLTGAVSNVEMDELQNRPLTNAGQALQGKAAGVYALQKSGKPGGDDAVINIRGVGTWINSDPLVLIDGFPGNINDVNPNDIKSISVLKDAASASIYGNRAANGVILITTKRGSAGQLSVNYNGYYGVQEPTRLPDVLNSVEYATLYNEASINTGMPVRYTDEEIEKFRNGTDPMYPDINYFDVYYDNATIQNHRINLTGGTDNLQYAFMMGHLNQKGILVGTKYKKTDFRTNIDSYFLKDKKLRLTARLAGNKGNIEEPTDEWNAKWYAATSPNWPLKNASDQWVAVIGERNFYGEIKEGSTRKIERYNLNSQFEAEYEFIDGLSAQLTYGFNVVNENRNAFHANVLLANLDGSTRYLSSNLSDRDDLNTQSLLTSLLRYRKTFGKHEVSLLAGYSEEEFKWKWKSAYRANFINNTQRILNLGDPSTQQNDAAEYDLGLQSYFGRINYIFNSRYLFEANIRRDGSSRFGEGNKWGTFPSFSAGWVISEEDFLNGVGWMDVLKIRASWGRLGNQNINNYYAASDILNTGINYSLGGSLNSGVAIASMSNKQTTWETSEQIDVGFDLVLNKNIDVTLDYFHKTTKDLLMQIPIPITLGNLAAPYQNVGEVQNKGIEFTGTYRKTFFNDLNFSTTLSLAHIKNEITDLHGRSPIINGVAAQVEGSPVYSFYGYELDGIYQINDFTWQNNSDPNIAHKDRNYVLKDGIVSVANFTAAPGDPKFKDLDGDGIVTMDNDRKVIGDQYPDLAYSLQLNASWKNFDLGLFFQGVQGIEGYTYYEIAVPFSGTASNMGAWWMDRWTPENPSNELPKVDFNSTKNNIHSTLYMEDASYLRLKNIELGYTLSDDLTSAAGINSLRIYGNIQNAFTITDFRGFDPEQTVDETRAQAYPQVRVFTLGVNLNF